jgi:hypothetical protein
VIEHKFDFEQAACEVINNRYSFECMDLVQKFEPSAIRDQYDHSRRSLLQACGTVNTALRLDYLRAAMAAITDHNLRRKHKYELDDLWLKSARFIESPYNLQCFNFVTRNNGFTGIFAEVCSGIRTKSAFRRLTRIARERGVLRDQDILLAAEEPRPQRKNETIRSPTSPRAWPRKL